MKHQFNMVYCNLRQMKIQSFLFKYLKGKKLYSMFFVAINNIKSDGLDYAICLYEFCEIKNYPTSCPSKNPNLRGF